MTDNVNSSVQTGDSILWITSLVNRPPSSRPQRRVRPRPVIKDEPKHIRWYIPSAIPIFDKLFEIESQTLLRAPSMAATTAAQILNCRIYYAFLFHLRILLARKETETASKDELSFIESVNSELHIESLPIHDDLVDLFRDAIPARLAFGSQCTIAPSIQKFCHFAFDFTNDGARLKSCDIPDTHSKQPSLKIASHLLHWYKWKHERPDDDDIPDDYHRLMSITYGQPSAKFAKDELIEPKKGDVLQHLFSNPIFKHAIPVRGGFTSDNFVHLSNVFIPPIVSILNFENPPTYWTFRDELLATDRCKWLTDIKYVAATLCHLGGAISYFREVNDKFEDDELDYALGQITHLEHQNVEQPFPDYGHWMNLFTSDVDEEFRVPQQIVNSEQT